MKQKSMKPISVLWILIVFIGLAATGCQSDSNVKQMTADICDCMRPMSESLKAIESYSASGEVDALEDAMESLAATAREADECALRLEEKYGDALVEEETRVRELMVEKCPEVARAMQEAEAAF